MKTVLETNWATLEKFGLLLISASGHTDNDDGDEDENFAFPSIFILPFKTLSHESKLMLLPPSKCQAQMHLPLYA